LTWLGGLFNALDAPKRYGDREQVRESSIIFLERGLAGIRKVIQATLRSHKPVPDQADSQFPD
jgi:hypothetical protein